MARRPLAVEGEAPAPASLAACYGRGLATNLANPRSAVSFASVFSLLLAPGTPAWVLAVAVGVVTVRSTLWHCALALAFSTVPARRLYARLQGAIDRLAGALIIALGRRLLLRDRNGTRGLTPRDGGGHPRPAAHPHRRRAWRDGYPRLRRP